MQRSTHRLLFHCGLDSVSTENILEDSRDLDEPSLMALPAPNQGLMTFHPSLLPSTMASKSS